MQVYNGKPCPKCGCDHYYIVNASTPIVHECTNCHYKWNPDNVRPTTAPNESAWQRLQRLKSLQAI